jgi:LCP family protein required for cell wall assembly
MGVVSAKDGLKANQAFNGDTLILVTFNPNTLTATMFSLPRDLYVPIACNNNKYAKINSSAAYGSTCVINTIKKLTDINIDYYVKINFKGVVELVDALGGVEVDVEEPDFSIDSAHVGQMCEQDSNRMKGNNLICVKPGKQTLKGEQALAYSRCRHLYAESDIARNRHQQDVIAAMTKKVRKINSISEVEDILNTVSHNIETNMTPEQILSFYSVGKNMLSNSNTSEISIKKTAIAYYNLRVWRGKMFTSALGYYQESLDAIVALMKENLGQKTPKVDYSVNYKHNEGYKEKITGRGLTGGTRLATMASQIGNSQSAASAYCVSNNISCTFEYTDSDQPYGVIVDQSVHVGTLMKNVSSCTFYMSNHTAAPSNPTPTEPTTPSSEDNKDKENQGGNSGGNGQSGQGNQGQGEQGGQNGGNEKPGENENPGGGNENSGGNNNNGGGENQDPAPTPSNEP